MLLIIMKVLIKIVYGLLSKFVFQMFVFYKSTDIPQIRLHFVDKTL